MPLYNYACTHCETSFELLLSMARMKEPISQPCPNCNFEGDIEQEVTSAAIGDPIRLGVKRPDAGFTEVLDKIKSKHPSGNWGNSRFSGTRSI